MKMPIGFTLLVLSVATGPVLSWASESHSKKEKHEDGHAHGAASQEKSHGESSEEEHGDDHEGEHGDEHGDEHGHEEGEEAGASRFGPGKAITAANKKDGIQLSEKAIATLGLKRQEVTGGPSFTVPKKGAVYSKDEVGVFRWRDGWFKLVDVTVERKGTADITLRSKDLRAGDQVVIEGTALLRAAELEAWGGSGDGHGH